MQNSFGPRNAAIFCISTKIAPCAKPSQKLTAAVPIALSGLAVQSSTKSAVVAGPKFSLHRASAEYRDFDLPPPDTKRWVTRRKAVVVNAVRAGVISLEEVCRRYELSVEEFLAWQRAIDTHGVPGLRVTRLQIYRDNPPSRVGKSHC